MARKKQCYSGIGGQAVLEGIMMRNGDRSALAVRKPDGTIAVEVEQGAPSVRRNKINSIPFVRGVVNFIDSMTMGVKYLNRSADIAMDGESQEPDKLERWLNKHFGAKANDVILSVTMVIAVFMAIGLFIMLPYAISAFMGIWIHNKAVLSIAEALMRILIFIGYVLLIGQLDDIKRLYMYHGAEHKCIDCVEKGRPLTVRDVMRSSRLHPRCGTSFLLYVMIISCILFFFINVENALLRLALRLCLIPVIAGISYELIRLAGRHDNFFTRLMSKPGLALQKLTTREPNEEMVEVAIRAVEAVYDWKAFLKEHYGYEVTEEWLRDFDEEWPDDEEEADETEDEELEETFEEKVEETFERVEDAVEEVLDNVVDKVKEVLD